MSQSKTNKQLGNLEYKNKNYTKAIQHYRAYIQTEHDDNIQALSNISLCYYKLQQFQQAINACDQALSMDEKYAKCYFRRAICRKQLLSRNPDDKVQKYKIYYDTHMFRKYYDPAETSKDIQDLFKFSMQMYSQLINSQPIKISPFQRDLMELQKENVASLALSWLDSKHSAIKKSIQQQQKFKINGLYKQLIDAKYKIKDQQQRRQLTEHIQNKIKLLSQNKAHKQKQIVIDHSNIINENQEKSIINQQIKQENKQETIKINNQAENKKIQQNNIQNQEKITATQQKITKIASNEQKIVVQPQQLQKIKTQIVAKIKKQQKQQQTKNNSKIENNKKQVSNPKLGNLNATQLYKQYFGSSLTNSRDVFVQFPTNLVQIVSNQHVSLSTKQQLIKMIKNKFNSFNFYIKNMPPQWKTKIKEIFTISSIPQDLISLYINKTQ